MSRKEALRFLAKDFINFVKNDPQKEHAYEAWFSKLQLDLAKQIQYELESIPAVPKKP